MLKTSDGCLILDQTSWHYKLTKWFFGKNWDTTFDDAKFMSDSMDWYDREDKKINEHYESGKDFSYVRSKDRPEAEDYRKDKPLSLCPYMRRVLVAIILFPSMCLVKGICRLPSSTIRSLRPNYTISWEKQNRIWGGIKYAAIPIVAGTLIWAYSVNPEKLLAFLIGIGFVVLGLGIGFGVFALYKKIQKKTKPWRVAHPIRKKKYVEPFDAKPERFLGLKKTLAFLSAYLHARHKNVCPCLERKK